MCVTNNKEDPKMSNINPIKFGVGNQYYKQNTNEDLAQQTGQENKPEAKKDNKQVQKKESRCNDTRQ